MIAFTILCMGIVNATAVFNLPTGVVTISGTDFPLNVTPTIENATNCSVIASSSSTGDSVPIGQFVLSNHSSIKTGETNFTIATTNELMDGSDWIFSGNCYNSTYDGTQGTETITATVFVVDNYVPSAPTSITPTSDSDGSVAFSSTVVGGNTTACTLFFVGINPGKADYVMTHSSNSCTYSLSNVPEGEYDYYVMASDGTNSSSSSITSLSVSVPSGGGSGSSVPKSTKVTAKALGIDAKKLDTAQSNLKNEFTGKELTKTGIAMGVGLVAGSVVPGIGNVIGAVIGLIVGVII